MALKYASELPETFNGKPTSYRFLDGFRNRGPLGKIVYAGSVAISPFIGFWPLLIPAAMEARSYNVASLNARDARISMLENTVSQQGAVLEYAGMPPLPQQGIAMQNRPDLNPAAPQDGRHVQALQTAHSTRQMTR